MAMVIGISPDNTRASTTAYDQTLGVTEYPLELVRSCTEGYSLTLNNKHTGDVCRDYHGPAFMQERQPGTVGFALVPRHSEPDGGAR